MTNKELNKIAKEYEWCLSQYVLEDIKVIKQTMKKYKHDNMATTIKILNEIGMDINTISEHEFLVGFTIQEMLSLKTMLTLVISHWQDYINCINDGIDEQTTPRDITAKHHKK